MFSQAFFSPSQDVHRLDKCHLDHEYEKVDRSQIEASKGVLQNFFSKIWSNLLAQTDVYIK